MKKKSRDSSARLLLSILLCMFACSAGLLAGPQRQAEQTVAPQELLTIGGVGRVAYAPNWRKGAWRFSNAQELFRVPSPASSGPGENGSAKPESGPPNNGPLARLLITTEKRSSHNDALKRLEDLMRSRSADVRFYAISQWPAVELTFTQKLPMRGEMQQGESRARPQETRDQRSQQRPEFEFAQLRGRENERVFWMPQPTVQRAIVDIAVADDVVSFDIMLAPHASKDILEEGLGIVKSFVADQQGKKNATQRALEQLRHAYKQKPSGRGTSTGSRPSGMSRLEGQAGAAQVQDGGVGELEVAVSPDGNKIVIASNASLRFSGDGGATFNGGTAVFPMNDPTVSRGSSGDFYLGQIAFPNGTTAQKKVNGCTNAVSRSADGGANFQLRGFSAMCPPGTLDSITDSFCFPDQPHIAADSFGTGSLDQVYAVWREFNSINIFGLAGTTDCSQVAGGTVTPSISCSTDSGATWTKPRALPGIDDFPRVAVASDEKVYVVGTSGDSVVLIRFSSCKSGLQVELGFPLKVVDTSGWVKCPVPGLDRCNNGNALGSPTVATDPANAAHVSVSFAESDGSNGERVLTMESKTTGVTFPKRFNLSAPSASVRFMPWSCIMGGNTFVGWYDRGAARPGHNDLTDYVLGGTILATPQNLTNAPDPQCALWLCAPRSEDDSESCSDGLQPELAGRCQDGSGGGSNKPCDFSSSKCPSGESCKTGGGCPKYGDYNGIACATRSVVAAWASATAPKGLPSPTGSGISIFSQGFVVTQPPEPSFDRVRFDIQTGNDNAGSSLELTAKLSGQKRSICLKPATSLSSDSTCPNGDGAKDQNGKDTWDNFTHSNLTFNLDTPEPLSAFQSLTITSRQSSCETFCDNWDLQHIIVTVSDSTNRLKPAVLLNVGNPHTSNADNCIARLKAPPHVNHVTFSLNAAHPKSSSSNFGGMPPGKCPQ